MQAMEAFVITQGSNILHVKIAHFDTNTLHVYLCCIDIFLISHSDLTFIDGHDMLDKVIFYTPTTKSLPLYIFFTVWYLGMMNRPKHLNKI